MTERADSKGWGRSECWFPDENDGENASLLQASENGNKMMELEIKLLDFCMFEWDILEKG